METRRSFIKKSSLSMTALCLPLAGCDTSPARPFQPPAAVKNAMVVWNSQTGNTRRAGRLIARTLESRGVHTDAMDYRKTDPATFGRYDLVIAGTPVHFFDIPKNFKSWLAALPRLDAIPAAAFVTFGGTGHNQHNTACRLLSRLADKGAVPVGLDAFGNMSMYAITWSTGREERILKYKHLPDAAACRRIRDYAHRVAGQVASGQSVPIDKEFFALDLLKGAPCVWGARLFVGRHAINTETCIGCGICTETCPTGAINPDAGTIDAERCVFCLGCINNCPAGAVEMEYMGKPVVGFTAFAEKHRLAPAVCR